MPTIAFVPNDPSAGFAPRPTVAAANRPAGRPQIRVQNPGAGASAADQALYWQCRETALGSLAFWESCRGQSVPDWENGSRLDVDPFDHGTSEPDAFFDGTRLVFSNQGGTQPGMSVDVVTHELGHAILNAVVPDLRHSSHLEHAAFHEAFADTLALLVALDDPDVAAQVVAAGLGQPNAAERLLESMATALAQRRGLGAGALQRRALNQRQWSVTGPFGSAMEPEYELSEAFTGSVYDSVGALFAARGGTNAADLAAAARTIGRLLASAIDTAPIDLGLFHSMGNTMLAATANADERQALEQGFARHGLEITSAALTQPEEAFVGPRSGTLHAVGRALSRRIARRYGFNGRAPRAAHGRMRVGGRVVHWVGHTHDVDLRPVHAALHAVRAAVYQETWLAREAEGWAIVQRPRDTRALEDAALLYAEHLYKRGRIRDRAPRRVPGASPVTHAVRRGKRSARLVRLRFGC